MDYTLPCPCTLSDLPPLPLPLPRHEGSFSKALGFPS